VPFYLRSGTALPKRLTEIASQFRHAPLMLFRPVTAQPSLANRLMLHIEPREGISWEGEAKILDQAVRMKTVRIECNWE
jgi:glucose-6-phosphate 1-dehydrogenase